MNAGNAGPAERTHWVGLDVSKETFDAAWLSAGKARPVHGLAQFPVRSFTRTAKGVGSFVRWMDGLLGKEDGEGAQGAVRCVMEATGRYSMELALWLLAERPGLAPAIATVRRARSASVPSVAKAVASSVLVPGRSATRKHAARA